MDWLHTADLAQFVLLSEAFFEQSRKVRPATTRPDILQRQVLFLNETELKHPLLSDLYRHHFPKLRESEKDQIQMWSALALATFNFVYQ